MPLTSSDHVFLRREIYPFAKCRKDLFIFLARCFIEKNFNFVQWAGNLARGRRVDERDGGKGWEV